MKDYLILQESKTDVFCCEHFVEMKWKWKFNEIKKKKRINQFSDGRVKYARIRHSVEGYFPSIKRPIKRHQLISIGGVSRSHVFPTQVIGFCC